MQGTDSRIWFVISPKEINFCWEKRHGYLPTDSPLKSWIYNDRNAMKVLGA